MSACPTPWKLPFWSAESAMAMAADREVVEPYECPCGRVHLRDIEKHDAYRRARAVARNRKPGRTNDRRRRQAANDPYWGIKQGPFSPEQDEIIASGQWSAAELGEAWGRSVDSIRRRRQIVNRRARQAEGAA